MPNVQPISKDRRPRRSRRAVWPAVAVMAALLLLWEAACRFGHVPPYVLPAPTRVLRALREDWLVLMTHSRVTLYETLLGLFIATGVGLVIGLIMDLSPKVKQALWPLLVVTQTIPVIVLAPIFMIYLGFGLAPKILTVILMCFFPITVNFVDGLQMLSREHLHLLRAFGAKRRHLYLYGKIPSALPSLFAGLRVSATYAMSGAIVGEWLSAERGLGYYMLRVNQSFRLDAVFAAILLVILWSLMLNGLVVLLRRLIEPGYGRISRMRRRRASRRLNERHAPPAVTGASSATHAPSDPSHTADPDDPSDVSAPR